MSLAFWIVVLVSYTIESTSSAPVTNTTSTLPASKTETTTTGDIPSNATGGSNGSPHIAASVLNGCTLLPADEDVTQNVNSLLSGGAKLIKYHLSVPSIDLDLLEKNTSHLYKPNFWIRTTGRHGQALLLLRPEYDVLSLTTLSLGVLEMHVSLVEHPPKCLTQLYPKDIETIIRELVINDFQNVSGGQLVRHQQAESVCNMHIIDTERWAEFRYICCNRNETGVQCSYLQGDGWLNLLFIVITLLKVIAVLFSPKLIPDSMYRLSHVAAPYIHKLEKNSPIKLRTVLTRQPKKYNNVGISFKLSKFKYMPDFKSLMKRMVPEVPYKLSLNEVCLRIKRKRLLPEDYAPVSMLKTMHESCFKCKIRERDSVNECCNSNFTIFTKPIIWYRVLKTFMQVLMLLVFVTPWVIRVMIYFKYEHVEMHVRKTAAIARDLRFTFPGSITLLLTPLHALFVFIYILLIVESFIFGVLQRATKEKMKFVMRRCFRDMREGSKSDAMGWAARTYLKPCTKFGGWGLCLGALIWPVLTPVIVLVLTFYIFPTVNLTLRLLAHLMLYLLPRRKDSNIVRFPVLSNFFNGLEDRVNREHIKSAKTLENEKKDNYLKTSSSRCFQLTVILLCLISLYAVLFLITELVAFAVEIFMYTLIGLILNASKTLTYISLVLLLGMYANDCFGFVSNSFLSFNKTLNGLVLGLGKEKVEQVIYDEEDVQSNRTFRIRTEKLAKDEVPVQLIKSCEGYPRWKISRLILFLSKRDVPLIPKTFFFKSCHMPFYAVPGELLMCYLRAAMEFGCILLFLFFVLIVVMAFGDNYGLSGTNQLLATVAGGFVPFMLRKLVFKSHAVPTADTDCLHFQVCLNKLLDTYVQSWPIFDINAVENKISFAPNRSRKANNKRANVSPLEVPDRFHEVEANDASVLEEDTIDLLIDISSFNEDDFPGLTQAWSHSHFDRDIGSTSFLDDFDDFEEPDKRESSQII